MEIPGWFDWPELCSRVVRQAPPGSLLVEVGVYHGKSLTYLAGLAKDAGKGLRVLGVDWCRGDAGAGWQVPGELAGAVVGNLSRMGLLDTAGLLVMPSVDAAGLIPDGCAWFVFIDASHDEESVRRDLAAWRPKVSSGGVMAGHDFGYPGVAAAVGAVFGDRAFPCPDSLNCWEAAL